MDRVRLSDGATCRKHLLAYSVVYRSFADIGAVKRWMDLNQLGRRNLSKEDRDELIRRLAAAGHRQKDIAEAVGLSKQAVSKIVNPSPQSGQAPEITNPELTTTQRLKDELARLRAEKDALAERERKESQARMKAEGERISLQNQLDGMVEMTFRWLIEEGRSLKSITDTEIAEMARVTKMFVGKIRIEIVSSIGANVNGLQVPEVTKSEAKELTVTQKPFERGGARDYLAPPKSRLVALYFLGGGWKQKRFRASVHASYRVMPGVIAMIASISFSVSLTHALASRMTRASPSFFTRSG